MNRRAFRISLFPDLFKDERRRPVTKVRRPFRKMFFPNVVASYCGILYKYHTFSEFTFETRNLQLPPDAVTVEEDVTAGFHPQNYLGQEASLSGTGLTPTVFHQMFEAVRRNHKAAALFAFSMKSCNELPHLSVTQFSIKKNAAIPPESIQL